MNTIKITVSNPYFVGINEVFFTRVDIADLEEIEMAAMEVCGTYLELHGDLICALTPDLDKETLFEACEYVIEEVCE